REDVEPLKLLAVGRNYVEDSFLRSAEIPHLCGGQPVRVVLVGEQRTLIEDLFVVFVVAEEGWTRTAPIDVKTDENVHFVFGAVDVVVHSAPVRIAHIPDAIPSLWSAVAGISNAR